MIAHPMEAVGGWILQVISTLGYGGVVLLMGIESACIPLPSELIMPFAGSLIAVGRFSLWGLGLAGALGCVLGSVPAWYLGRYGGRPLAARYGRFLLVSHRDLELADRLFARFGEPIVFAARLLPVVRTFIAFPAGVARMPMGRFLAYTFLGSLPWCLGLAFAGMKLGAHWGAVRPWFHRFDLAIAALLLAGAAGWIARHLRRQPSRAS